MQTFNLEIPGFTIACKAWGNPSLPVMLALHGWLDNANSFDPIAPYLAERFYFIAIDLPGHGLSSHLAQGAHYHFIDGIFSIINLINVLNKDRIHLMGHSLGACIASLVAGVIPDKLYSLSLIEALGPFSSPEETCCAQLSNFVKNELNKEPKEQRCYESAEQAALARVRGGYLPLVFARLLCERGVTELNGSFYWRHDRRLLSPSPLRLTEGQVISCLEAIRTQTCLIWGDKGFAFDSTDLEQRVEAVNYLRVHKIAGGHHLHMEKPDAVAQHLVEFYSSLN